MDPELAKAIKETVISDQLFARIKSKAEEEYGKVESVHCPYFDEAVKFNAKGLDHIKFKGWGKSRNKKDLYARLKFLPLVPRILKTTTTLQGFLMTETLVRKKNFGSWGDVFNRVYFYEFIYVHKEKMRLKVIVRKDGDGEHYFYSVIPFWKMNADRKSTRLNSSHIQKSRMPSSA